MQNFSVTQTTNYASALGIIVLILQHFHINIASDEITTLVGGVLSAGGVISNWYHRYQKGDLTATGVKI